MFLNQSHCPTKFLSHVILKEDWGPYNAATPCDGTPGLVMAGLDAKIGGRAVVLRPIETGLFPSDDAHWVRTLLPSVACACLLQTGLHTA